MKLIKTVLLISAFAVAAIANAQTCNESITATTPDSRFTDNGNGTVTDKQTNLVWMRCALGQTWEGATCTGSATTYTWQQALQAAEGYTYGGSDKWRVPNLKQLASIVELACIDPAINLTIFPQTRSFSFWTSSLYRFHSDYEVTVSFNSGNGSNGYKNDGKYVRLVHSDSN